MDRGAAVLLGATAAIALAALLPIASLVGGSGSPSGSRFEISTVRGGRLGLPWLDPRTPAETEQQATVVLFGLLVGMGAATLATAAVTVVALVGAREAGRSQENVVRRAVGASRRTLRDSALLEAGVIAVPAAAVGLGLGSALSELARTGWPGSTAAYRPAATVALVLAVAALVVLSAVLPVIFARQSRLADAEPAARAIFGPAVAQFAAGLAVLVTGTLLAQYAGELAGPSDPVGEGAVLELTTHSGDRAELGRGYAALLERLGAAALAPSLTSPGALTGLGTIGTVITDCGFCPTGDIALPLHVFYATHHVVSSDSFQALGAHLVAGRGFRPGDRADTAPVVVVNRALARLHFQRGEAIGRKMLVGDGKVWYTVVGIVDDAPARGFGGRLQPPLTVYLSILQHPAAAADLLVRGNRASASAGLARREAAALLAPFGLRMTETNLSRIRAGEAAPVRWFARWIAFEGWVTVLVAAVGMFAVMRIWVRSLLPELGVRRALGATRARVLALVVRQAAAVAVAGIVAGWWFGSAVWRVLPTILRDAATWDAGVVAVAAAPLVLATMAGALLPAVRAVRSDPAKLLAGDR
jgi:predicted lysophospholipase L1 biosynthesis ABC-type transport system permease subunit